MKERHVNSESMMLSPLSLSLYRSCCSDLHVLICFILQVVECAQLTHGLRLCASGARRMSVSITLISNQSKTNWVIHSYPGKTCFQPRNITRLDNNLSHSPTPSSSALRYVIHVEYIYVLYCKHQYSYECIRIWNKETYLKLRTAVPSQSTPVSSRTSLEADS